MRTKAALKKAFYETVSPLLLRTGVDHLIRKTNKVKRLIVLYHGIVQRNHSGINARNLPVKQFERQLQYFKKNFEIVSLEQVILSKQSESMIMRPMIALTFDDGLENNFLLVLPLLEKYKIPASFFIPGIAVANEAYLLPAETIEIIRLKTREKILKLGDDSFTKHGKYGLLRNGNHLDAHEFVMQLRPRERNPVLNSFAERYHLQEMLPGVDRECWKLMNATQIKQLSESKWATIGSHAQEHYNLVYLTDEEAEHELQISKQLLENCSGKIVDSIAYPWGAYDERIKLLSKKCGYKNLLAAGSVEKTEEDILPRVGVMSSASFNRNMMWINRAFGQYGF